MKKFFQLLFLCLLMIVLAACGDKTNTANNINGSDKENLSIIEPTPVVINTSPDKYTWYIKEYTGKNCATFGYTSLGGDRMDEYGAAVVKLVFVSKDGSYVNFKEDDILKEYVVTGQNISPNSEMKLVFEKNDNGEEYNNLVASQTYEEIVLSVRKIEEKDENNILLTEIKPSPDKYTWYIADYVGRNLADCGYTSMGGDRRVKYGDATLKLVLVSEEGSFIELDDEETLKNYVVTKQNVAPNTELKLIFSKDNNGVEYGNLVESQNIEEIELYLKKISKE